MSDNQESSQDDRGKLPEQFPQTRWSVVLAARDESDQPKAAAALNEICQAYWFPLYV